MTPDQAVPAVSSVRPRRPQRWLELLEAAARAAGYQQRMTWPVKACPCGGYQQPECFDGNCRWERDNSLVPVGLRSYTNCPVGWNPLTDDGDALRLAVKLGISVHQWHCSSPTVQLINAERGFAGPSATESVGNEGDDNYAATRRAIVRAAAALSPSVPLPKDEPECPIPAAPPAGGEPGVPEVPHG